MHQKFIGWLLLFSFVFYSILLNTKLHLAVKEQIIFNPRAKESSLLDERQDQFTGLEIMTGKLNIGGI